jgi:ketosteroid isomerase-like protein
MDQEARLRATYAAINARDIDAVLAGMTPDMDWPNAWEGGRVAGHEALRCLRDEEDAPAPPGS